VRADADAHPAAGQHPWQRHLGLDIASAALVFSIGLCALVGALQGWLAAGGTVLFVCGASSAFLGLIGALVGVGGLFAGQRSRATAVVGLVRSILGMYLFLAALSALQREAVR
jgi:hypothetical protein